MTTYVLKPKDAQERWHVVDATGVALGRLASDIAATLRGKKEPSFTPSADHMQYVVVINAAQVKVTGDLRGKKYYHHSMYPGGLKAVTQEKLLANKPELVVEKAVKGMLPHNSLGAQLLKHLKVYAGAEHPHAAQINAGKGKGRSASAGG